LVIVLKWWEMYMNFQFFICNHFIFKLQTSNTFNVLLTSCVNSKLVIFYQINNYFTLSIKLKM